MPGADGATIFVERLVAHVVHTILDGAPMVPRQSQECISIGPRAWQGRNEVGGLGGRLPVQRALSMDLTDLLHARPIEMLIQSHRAGQRAPLNPSMPFIERGRGLSFRLPLALFVGGKRPRQSWSVPVGFPAVM